MKAARGSAFRTLGSAARVLAAVRGSGPGPNYRREHGMGIHATWCRCRGKETAGDVCEVSLVVDKIAQVFFFFLFFVLFLLFPSIV